MYNDDREILLKNYINKMNKHLHTTSITKHNIISSLIIDEYDTRFPYHGLVLHIRPHQNGNVWSKIFVVQGNNITSFLSETGLCCSVNWKIFIRTLNVNNLINDLKKETLYNHSPQTMDEFIKIINEYLSYNQKQMFDKKMSLSQKNIWYSKTYNDLIAYVEIIIPSYFLKDNCLPKEYKEILYKKIFKYISNDKRFLKYGIPVNFLKIKHATISKTHILNMMLDLKVV